jgi:hypothetical protein
MIVEAMETEHLPYTATAEAHSRYNGGRTLQNIIFGAFDIFPFEGQFCTPKLPFSLLILTKFGNKSGGKNKCNKIYN